MQVEATRRAWRTKRALLLAAAFAAAAPAQAKVAGETLDGIANGIAWLVLVLVPTLGVGLFLMVHVLPEKFAERRHHPQQTAIKTVCLLSLVFGGMLWPIAWLWAFTRPVAFKAAYGTDKHESYFLEKLEQARAGGLTEHDYAQVDAELSAMEARAALLPELRELRQQVSAHLAGAAASQGGRA